MVRAFLFFDTTDGPGFVNALGEAAPALEGAKGYHGHELLQGVEEPARYVLLVDWDSKDDHMSWMGENEAAFMGKIGPFIAGMPDIKHFT